MGKNNPRKQSSPEAKKQAAIWCAIAVIAVAVMMLMANPWKHQPATTAPQANSATQTQSDAKHKAKAKNKGKAASTSDSLEQKAQTMFTGDAEQISNDVRDLLNAPENSNVDTLSTLLYRHGRQDLAEATDLYDAIGQQKDIDTIRTLAREWYPQAMRAAIEARRSDLSDGLDNTAKSVETIHDARKLGKPKMIILGVQHMFAMFGATILVPILTGLDISTTLLMAGLGTLLFHCITKFKVPAFLGSSFAFLGGYAAIKAFSPNDPNSMLPYACLGVACAGLIYFILAAVIKAVGIEKVMRFFPPVVTGPIIIAIGLGLAPSAVSNCTTNWFLAVVALAVIVVFNIWGKGMAKIIPIILGLLISYGTGLVLYFISQANPDLIQNVPWLFSGGADANGVYQPIFDFTSLNTICDNISKGHIFGSEGLIGIPIHWDKTVFGGIDYSNGALIASSIIAIVPIAFATMMEHIGDICAISSTTGNNYIKDPGLHRTLVGDGLATTLASLFGGPANTTYGENTGVLALTRVYDPRVIRIAAYFAVAVSFFPIVSVIIGSIPSCIIGGISFVLYGMISAIGVRNVVENKVDFTKSRNLIVAAVILVCALGLSSDTVSFTIGSAAITLSPLAVASIAGIVLNAVFPGKDYKFDTEDVADAANFEKEVKPKEKKEKKEKK